ncbi:MAG: type II toxin-antitoxin system RelE/ParE family toxin [Paludibacter sp.]
MAKRKLIWSENAKIKLFEILDYFNGRNNSKTYSKKLYSKFVKEVDFLTMHPEIGIKTDLDNVRGLIIDDYIFFYEINKSTIVIYTIWDTRQNPDNLQIK